MCQTTGGLLRYSQYVRYYFIPQNLYKTQFSDSIKVPGEKVYIFFCALFITFSDSAQTLYLFLHRYQWKKFP